MIHSILVPQPKFRLESCKIKGKQILALFVEQGDSPPYGVYPANPRYCVRRGATTQPATQAEVQGLAQRNYSDMNTLW
jgi:predicted HTH transcriptional regulator